jgi:3-oxoacyl-[acyl-carrier protein] reductase
LPNESENTQSGIQNKIAPGEIEMDLGLQGKKALVTGSSRGLGFATAHQLAKEGCDIALNSRSGINLTAATNKIKSDTKSKIIPIEGDITQVGKVEQIVDQAGDFLGGIDILITNSGGPPTGKIQNIDDQTWHSAMELNFMSHMRLIRAALPFLSASEAASVLTITSMSVKQPVPNLLLSNSIRGATVGLTKTLALELGSEGIRFNTILPGFIRTERVLDLLAERAEANSTTIDQEIAKQAKESPLGRIGSPQEFANVAAFIVSPAASYLTGGVFLVDGGMYKATY